MTQATVPCPACGAESHVTCRFCIHCGKSLPAGTAAPKRKSTKNVTPPKPTDVPQASTADFLRQVASQAGFEEVKSTSNGLSVRLPTEGDRTQQVHVFFDGKDDQGQDVITFLSICAPVDDRAAMTLLRANSGIFYGSYAVRKIKGQEYFVVTSSQLAPTADSAEIKSIIRSVALRADRLEKKLSGGDKF